MRSMAVPRGIRQHRGMESTTAPRAATRKVHDARRHPRLARELATLQAMVRLHCRQRHAQAEGLCEKCQSLMDYATRRLDRCVFGDDKPTCANCRVHCYNAPMREDVRSVMRYAGPKMLLRHPILAFAHMVVDSRRAAPDLPAKAGAAQADAERTPPASAAADAPAAPAFARAEAAEARAEPRWRAPGNGAATFGAATPPKAR
jgi:hypothetical protein